MKRAKSITETFEKLAVAESPAPTGGTKINEKVEITTEQGAAIKAAFAKAGFSVEINTSTNGNVYIDGLYSCGGRYCNIEFDKGGFRISVSNQGSSYCNLLPHSEALKLQAELKTYIDLLEKIKAINPELV